MPAARPSQAAIARAIAGAVQAGLTVGAVEVRPDGTIRLVTSADQAHGRSDVDRWFEEHDAS